MRSITMAFANLQAEYIAGEQAFTFRGKPESEKDSTLPLEVMIVHILLDVCYVSRLSVKQQSLFAALWSHSSNKIMP